MNTKKTYSYVSLSMAVFILLLIVYSVGNYYYKNVWLTQKIQTSPSILPTEPAPGKVTLRGMIWTSGLLDEEKNTLNIQSDYQLVKTSGTSGWDGKTDGVYMVNPGLDLSGYLGKCTEVMGNTVSGWEDVASNNFEINGKWTYNRSAMEPVRVRTLELTSCIDDSDVVSDKLNHDENRVTITGTLSFTNRPSPDIAYDIVIIPDKPLIDKFSSAGGPAEVKKLDISSGTYSIYKDILENIGNKVTVSGYMQWGYSESRYLLIDKLIK